MDEEQLAAYNLGVEHQGLDEHTMELHQSVLTQVCYNAGRNKQSLEEANSLVKILKEYSKQNPDSPWI